MVIVGILGLFEDSRILDIRSCYSTAANGVKLGGRSSFSNTSAPRRSSADSLEKRWPRSPRATASHIDGLALLGPQSPADRRGVSCRVKVTELGAWRASSPLCRRDPLACDLDALRYRDGGRSGPPRHRTAYRVPGGRQESCRSPAGARPLCATPGRASAIVADGALPLQFADDIAFWPAQ